MSSRATQSEHIGSYIREAVLPKGMAVTSAARSLGVGRPALSNLLNGRAALSPEMADRLERAFGASAHDLLRRQDAYQQSSREGGPKGFGVRRYAPHFLTIKAVQIEAWARTHLDARQHLAVLLRKLIHSTGLHLRRVDFPGYDNAERKGADGVVHADEATAWIPAGVSLWEFGTTSDPQKKANKDFATRLRSIPKTERLGMTYVQVTPLNWPAKSTWEKAHAAKKEWKAVRVLDASDLEQWLEESIPAQMWLAERLQLPGDGYQTLDECWKRWAIASDPPLSKALFAPAVSRLASEFEGWVKGPSASPFVVAADSTGEALAFLACLFEAMGKTQSPEAADGRRLGDLGLVFSSGDVLRSLSKASSEFVPIAASESAEKELAALYRGRHCITVRPRNTVDREPNIALGLLGYEEFKQALLDMRIPEERVDRLGRECGHSPTILRRRLSNIDAIRQPDWARSSTLAAEIVPMALVGAWHANSRADREILEAISDHPYDHLEAALMRLRIMEDAPVWSVGDYRGVASKIDALFAVAYSMTVQDLRRFFEYAEYVLSESDPALELPEDKRWMAGVYNKLRDHSNALRSGICETLVLLSVYGNMHFRERLGIDCEREVSWIIEKLLTPLSLHKLQSHERDLPRYAEAAPESFLRILEGDLRTDEPVVLGLLTPVASSPFGQCLRTGLLWALERLAWEPRNLPRVSQVLAQLSQTTIDDNWANKPIASLQAIFRCWMPQTAAPLSVRIGALETVNKRRPTIGWKVCVAQFGFGQGLGDYSDRPEWRNDAAGAGGPVTVREMVQFQLKCVELCLNWPGHTEETLGDLVERLEALRKEHVDAVWQAIAAWAPTAGDEPKARLRERIRRFAFTRRGHKRSVSRATRDRARETYQALEPRDLVVRHAWLFEKSWVDESADELGEDYDPQKRGEGMDKARLVAMQEIWSHGGVEQAMRLLTGSEAPGVIGHYAAKCVGAIDTLSVIGEILKVPSSPSVDLFLTGFLGAVDSVPTIVRRAIDDRAPEEIVRVLCCAPFNQNIWDIVDAQDGDVPEQYWRRVPMRFQRFEEAELTTAVDRLLAVGRARTAFNIADLSWDKVETSRIKKLLVAVATCEPEPANGPVPHAHDVAQALEELNKRADVTEEEMARFEFLYLQVLEHTQHRIPNLERQVSKIPELFAQAVAYAFKRSDNQEDPPQLILAKEQKHVAVSAYDLLRRVRLIPGTRADGTVDREELRAWVIEVRKLCALYGRSVIGDQMIGQLLSHAPAESDENWPCRAVCEVLEGFSSNEIAKGFSMGVHNGRGAVWRGRGGDQERELAKKYRDWSAHVASEFPYLGGVLDEIGRSYEYYASREDMEEKVTQRLRR